MKITHELFYSKVYTSKLDVIGDVHGCIYELMELLEKLGYKQDNKSWFNPEGRFLLFVGDLVDRGTSSYAVLKLVRDMVVHERALCALGNHDDKLKRWLKGSSVKISSNKSTVEEFNHLTQDQKDLALEFLEKCPYFILADFDKNNNPRLVVSHAAWKPHMLHENKKQIRSYCCFGPTTGKRTTDRYFERVDWTEHYPDGAPTCITGHTSYIGPIADRNNCICVDTACVYGGYLTAARWPEKQYVQVAAKKCYAEKKANLSNEPQLVSVPQKINSRFQPVIPEKEKFELRLNTCLRSLKENENEILKKIDFDEKLIKREIDFEEGKLVLANATKGLFTPELQHQIFAKGIVYLRKNGKYRLVSVPYIKMYNYQERIESLELSNYFFDKNYIKTIFNEKVDGSMIQTFSTYGFEKNPKVLITTRGMLEGFDFPFSEDHFDFISEARKILEQKYDWALDAKANRGLTYLWELVHPEARVITDYGERVDLILTGAVDYLGPIPRYLTRKELELIAKNKECPISEVFYLEGSTFEDKIEDLEKKLKGKDLEGSVVTFESADSVLHRVKIKTPDYIQLVKLTRHCSYKRTCEFASLLREKGRPAHTWKEFEDALKKKGADQIPEEILNFYKEYFEEYLKYEKAAIGFKSKILDLVENFKKSTPLSSKNPKEWRKQFAQWVLTNHKKISSFMFSAVDNKLSLKAINEATDFSVKRVSLYLEHLEV